MIDISTFFDDAQKAGLTEIHFYSICDDSKTIIFQNNHIDSIMCVTSNQFSISANYFNKRGYFCCDGAGNIDSDKIINTIKNNSIINDKHSQNNITCKQENKFLAKQNSNKFYELSMDEKKDFIYSVNKFFNSQKMIESVINLSYSENLSVRTVINTNTSNYTDSSIYCLLIGYFKFKDIDEPIQNYILLDSPDFSNIKVFFDETQKNAFLKNSSLTLKNGHYKIIFKNNVINALLPAISTQFNSRIYIDGLSSLPKYNDKIFSDKITIYDDPHFKNGIRDCEFDDEGIQCKKSTLVLNGKFKNLMYNKETSFILHQKNTGNGFYNAYNLPIDISPTNFYIAPSHTSFSALLRNMEYGILITNINGIQSTLNYLSCDYSLHASGYLVKNGEIQGFLRNFNVSGNLLDLFNSVVDIGDDLIFSLESYGSPSILVKKQYITFN